MLGTQSKYKMSTPRRSARIAARMGVPATQSVTIPVTASVPVTLRRSARIAARMGVTVQSKPNHHKSTISSIYQITEHNAFRYMCTKHIAKTKTACAKIHNFLDIIQSIKHTKLRVQIITNMFRYMCTEDACTLLLVSPSLRNIAKNKLVDLVNDVHNKVMNYDTAIDFTDSVSCLKRCIKKIEKSPICVF